MNGRSPLSKIIFNKHQIKLLKENPHVKQVSERSISYHTYFHNNILFLTDSVSITVIGILGTLTLGL